MEKIIIIAIAEKKFKLTEPAFAELSNFMSFVNKSIANKEQIEDIERQIAILFENEISETKEFISSANVSESVKLVCGNEKLNYNFNKRYNSRAFRKAQTKQFKKKLTRAKENKIIGGVCSGIAKRFNTEPVIVRLIVVFFTIFQFYVGIVYLILWAVLPEDDENSIIEKAFNSDDSK